MYLKLTERGTNDIQIIECRSCLFRRLPEAVAVVDGAASYPLYGNAYLLNERGDTIETFPMNGRKEGRQ